MNLFPGMSATTSLSLQFDNRPPQHLIDVAQRIDRAEQAKRPRAARVRLGNITLHARVAVDLMALDMLDAFHRRGAIARDDLKRAGFTDQDIDRHGGAAFKAAAAQDPRLLRLVEVSS